MVYLIGIVGGSGSGKSTLAYGLQDKFPDLIEVVHFDDYQKSKDQGPVDNGMINWDHPDAIDFDRLFRDLKLLKAGSDVEIMTKSSRHNPDYKQKGRIPHIMKSKPIIIVEGYLAFTDKRIRDLFDYKIFLDLHFDARMKRRTKFINPEYVEKILMPMHAEYVEPTKEFADIVIDVEKHSITEIQDLVLSKLKEAGIL